MRGRRARTPGFTLIELIAVVTIIAILGTLVVMRLSEPLDHTRRTKVDHDLKAIVHAARMAEVQTGHLPLDWDELRSRFEEPPLDPWQQAYLYEVREGQPYAICLGQDHAEGGEGRNADTIYPSPQM